MFKYKLFSLGVVPIPIPIFIDVHLELESALAAFTRREEAIVYSYGFTTGANTVLGDSVYGCILQDRQHLLSNT